MPLKIKGFEPEHLGTLNRWADQKENELAALRSSHAQMKSLLKSLFEKNPTLVRPDKP